MSFIADSNIGILLETKLHDSFSLAQFAINSRGSGLLYILKDIPSELLNYKSDCEIEY